MGLFSPDRDVARLAAPISRRPVSPDCRATYGVPTVGCILPHQSHEYHILSTNPPLTSTSFQPELSLEANPATRVRASWPCRVLTGADARRRTLDVPQPSNLSYNPHESSSPRTRPLTVKALVGASRSTAYMPAVPNRAQKHRQDRTVRGAKYGTVSHLPQVYTSGRTILPTDPVQAPVDQPLATSRLWCRTLSLSVSTKYLGRLDGR